MTSWFHSASPPGSPTASLRTPANRRISNPAADRLSTITEGANARPSVTRDFEPNHVEGPPSSRPATGRGSRPTTPTVPPRSILRNTPYNNTTENGDSAFPSSAAVSSRTAPPAYTWVPEPIEPVNARHEREKLNELRRQAGATSGKRGGWGRILLIGGVILLVIVGLAVGLGVGLTVGKRNNNGNSSNDGQSGGQTSPPPQQFPLGQYSFRSNLRNTTTDCTSNPSTWRCLPYSTYDQNNPIASQLLSYWSISNTSGSYATNETRITSTNGIPANLSISSANNPFSVNFQDLPLTLIGSPNNASAARLTFSFSTNKTVVPSTAITSNNAAAVCFFNSTVFDGTIYLSAPATLASSSTSASQAMTLPPGQSEPWPYAVEIIQRSPGGQDVPACYLSVNQVVGERITTGLQPQPTSSQCLCQYNNF